MSNDSTLNQFYWLIVFSFFGIILIVDTTLPVGISVPVLYVFPTILGVFLLSGKRAIIFLLFVATFVTVLGFLLSDVREEILVGVVNRGLSLAMVFAAALLTEAYLSSLKEIQISERKYLQVKADRVDDLEQFVYIVSHDLREPARRMNQLIQLIFMQCENSLDEQLKDYLRRLIKTAKNQIERLDELLILSQVQTAELKIENIDLADLVTEVTSQIEQFLDERKATVVCENSLSFKGHKVLIKVLLENLISNGIKFNKSTQPKVSLSMKEKRTTWEFSVKDNGVGVDEMYYDQIFKFFNRGRMSKDFPGTGMGLAICKKIVEKLGGEIWLNSKNGVGTIFSFSIKKFV